MSSLNVKNAFHSAAIEYAKHHLGVSVDLCRIRESYFQNRVLICDTEEGERNYITTGYFRTPSWARYYGMRRMLVSFGGVKLVSFGDNITLVVYGESTEEVELTATHAIGIVEDWMRSRQMALAHHKKEVVVVNSNMPAKGQAWR